MRHRKYLHFLTVNAFLCFVVTRSSLSSIVAKSIHQFMVYPYKFPYHTQGNDDPTVYFQRKKAYRWGRSCYREKNVNRNGTKKWQCRNAINNEVFSKAKALSRQTSVVLPAFLLPISTSACFSFVPFRDVPRDLNIWTSYENQLSEAFLISNLNSS